MLLFYTSIDVSFNRNYINTPEFIKSQKFYTDDWGAYERHLEEGKHKIGKENTQKIERKKLNFRT